MGPHLDLEISNNPNTVDSQDGLYAFTIRAGTNTENPQATTLGAQGVALNGVVLFNLLLVLVRCLDRQFSAAGFNWNAVFNESVYGVMRVADMQSKMVSITIALAVFL